MAAQATKHVQLPGRRCGQGADRCQAAGCVGDHGLIQTHELTALTGTVVVHLREELAAGLDELAAGLAHPGDRRLQIAVIAQTFFHQRIQNRILESFPPGVGCGDATERAAICGLCILRAELRGRIDVRALVIRADGTASQQSCAGEQADEAAISAQALHERSSSVAAGR